jgi:Flp pilus assembly pilin Flp
MLGPGLKAGILPEPRPASRLKGLTVSNSRGSESGATAVEYAIMLTFIAAVIIGVVATLGLALPGGFQQVIDGL